MWTPDGPQGYESRKIRALLPRYAKGRVLEIGCGPEKAYSNFIGYDRNPGAANLIGNAVYLWPFADEAFDTVFSSHCLEDMTDMVSTLNEWARVLKEGGCMILYLPSANLYPKVGEPGANPAHKNNIFPEDVPVLFRTTRYAWLQLELEERSKGNEYSIFAVYQKIGRGGSVAVKEKPLRSACVFRTGGIGDILLAANTLPGLKRAGYYTCFMTSKVGKRLLENNPYADEVVAIDLQDLSAKDLHELWEAHRPRFDKWLNLQNSMENALLSFPNTVEYYWPTQLRHEKFNRNYSEFAFELAELPFETPQVFFPTDKEIQKAKDMVNPDEFNIMFIVSGSTVNKRTPYVDQIVGAILHAIPNAKFFLIGDASGKQFETSWTDNLRVKCLCGAMRLRDSLTLAKHMDIVIGPETGIMQAICYDEVVKLIYLSHSSPENLTKHWTNTIALTPLTLKCYPCHKIHYSADTCNVDPETGASLCVFLVGPENYIRVIVDVWSKKGGKS